MLRMASRTSGWLVAAVSLLVVFPAGAEQAAAAALSDVMQVPRPAKGEYFGVYLKNQKVGYMFSSVTLSPERDTITARNEVHFKAKVGKQVTERHMIDVKTYESKPAGKLLSFSLEQSGDGGDQILEGTSTPTGIKVLRKRPGKPNETLTVKASREVVEDADQARVALKRNAKVEGLITDTMELEEYRVVTTLGPVETRLIGGVKVKVRHVQTLSDKEKVPADVWVDEAGRIVETEFGATMRAVAEPGDVAKRVDLVEIFGLSRVILPKPLPESARKVPGSVQLVMSGVPDKFFVDSYRQTFKKLPDGKVLVTVSAAQPKVLKARPLIDPNGGEYLKTSIIIESDAPEIKALAKKIVGDEKDAWTVAKKVSHWVYKNMTSDYGSSSDRATDVLREMKGDCTEHSLLTVSLLRSLGIPAKRIDGVIYLKQDDGVPAYYWHEWVEAFVGEWTQLDPTFDQDVADATHFGVGEETRAEITPLIGAMQVVEVR
jgi:transglutaminase-like putative cysteine protease